MTVGLRPLRRADEVALRVLFADPETRRWNPGPQQVDRWLVEMTVPAPDHRTWAVVDGDDFAGLVSVFGIVAGGPTAEIGFRTMPAARGRGVARAAVRLAVDGVAAEGISRLELFHAVDNTGSCRVALACGFTLAETLPANHEYGDGRRHDEHRHVRTLE